MKLANPPDFEHDMALYKAEHTTLSNRLVHIFTTPVILGAGIVFAAYVPPPFASLCRNGRFCNAASSSRQCARFVDMFDWPMLFVGALASQHIRLAPIAGCCVTLLELAMALSATALVKREGRKADAKGVPCTPGRAARVAGSLSLFSWWAQLHVGHRILEPDGYRVPFPPEFYSLTSAVIDAPLFVWFIW
eukprot:CAMPEP_0119311874 /NCGR_PEP_ID=MMETSP1333-20130426/24299_1 /TAXON_ID=418940 /ORGANISM="Scyphosphaera apsteinii, Strain RCC1455" /LENGTH=190 /DNA_ID=CAMNT_0007316375 /DNA_START=217 /DNA_END=789 /DNA_ORIENTATION=-